LKIQKALQMALRMVALNRATDGRWFARKVIPKDVRDEYAKLYGVRREAHLKLPANMPTHEVKARLGEWTGEVETQIATLRAQRNGEGQPLTRLSAMALAGHWYNWFVKQHEDNPGSPQYWHELGEALIWNVLRPLAPDEYEENPRADETWEWAKVPEVREAVRPLIAEQARVATFLASEGIALNVEARKLFVDAVSDNLHLALSLLEKRARGDCSHDPTPGSFPPFVRGAGTSCWDLFVKYVGAVVLAPNTVTRWRAVFFQMQRGFAETPANSITVDAARAWINGLKSEERTPQTVRNVWLSAARTVFGWAVEQKEISKNPFADVKVRVPKATRKRETKAFRPEEARTILRAALTFREPKTPRDRARRWVAWLCAYSGARAGEMTQLRGCDVH
jgi:hypothetical protein